MATVGRNLAVAEIGRVKLNGFFAWIAWMMVHLMSIIGVKNRLFVLINWIWQYITYDQSLRLIIHPSEKKSTKIVYEKIPDTPLVRKRLVGM
jgi:NADH dehydrogenase